MINRSAEDISEVVASFYDAAYGVHGWDRALGDLASLFHGSRSWLFFTSDGVVRGHTSQDDPGFHSDQAQVAMLADPMFHASHSQAEGAVVRHSGILDLEGFYRRPLFQDWLRVGFETHEARANRRMSSMAEAA